MPLTRKILATVIKKGYLPLQGTKLLVSIATNLSRGESIILQPVTPHALQPNPMHMGVTIWYNWKVLIDVEIKEQFK